VLADPKGLVKWVPFSVTIGEIERMRSAKLAPQTTNTPDADHQLGDRGPSILTPMVPFGTLFVASRKTRLLRHKTAQTSLLEAP
jgi:hypothetical protein